MDANSPIHGDRDVFIDIDHLDIATTRALIVTKNQGATELARITEAGRLGIGTNSPSYPFVLYEPTSGLIYMQIHNSDAATGLLIGISAAEEAYISNEENEAMYLGTDSTNRIKIHADGDVSIANDVIIGATLGTNPATQLEIQDAATDPIITIDYANTDNAGDPQVVYRENNVAIFSHGIDTANSNRFVLAHNTTIGAQTDFCMDSNGHIGMNLAPDTNYRVIIDQTCTDLSRSGLKVQVPVTVANDLALLNYGLNFIVTVDVADTKTDSGTAGGFIGQTLMIGSDSGQLDNAYGGAVSSGIQNTADAGTVLVDNRGLWIQNYARAGTVTSNFDLYISTPFTGGTITNDWCIYSVHNATSLLTGNLWLKNQLLVGAATYTFPASDTSCVIGVDHATRPTIAFDNTGIAAPANPDANSNGDKLIFWNNSADFKSAIGVGSYQTWIQGTDNRGATTSDSIAFYTGNSKVAALRWAITNAGHLNGQVDNQYIKLGAGQDIGIMYDGTDAYFRMLTGSGAFVFDSYTTIDQDCNVKIIAGEAKNAYLTLACDEGDDNVDWWRLRNKASTNVFGIQTYQSGAWVSALSIHTDSGVHLHGLKSGVTQAAAGAVADELWYTNGHATLPNNVVMMGV